ncbi:MFS transporter [Paenibacillus sediminis]|uniref:MFS family arabinose efflux permease n=1 Tax=Paenibacillus sediminis TaxID=664909 RepID=A0ABS4H0M7_9BACL|nr:MFS transporter [Paenibacillus sediminis]MBP1936065.1 putative MFS family arabinose efflux permease [Paenibacillus sediminis]
MNAKRVFFLFLLLNILNYLDRNVTSGVLPVLQQDFKFNDAAAGLLGTAFMITYAITAIPFGIWSDRWKPHKVAAIGTAIWSIATIGSAFAWSFSSLYLFRALVGIGEAAFVTTGSSILSGLYPEGKRAKTLGLFNLGLPIGSALGVTLGGAIASSLGWEWAFAIVGIPGLLLAYLTWRLPDVDFSKVKGEGRLEIRKGDVIKIFSNIPFLLSSLGYAGIAFAFGAIAYFGPSLLHRSFGFSVASSGTVAGGLIVVAGLIGAPLGGMIADMWQKRNPRGRIYTVSSAMLLSAICLAIGMQVLSLPLLFASVFFMMWHVGIASAIVFDVSYRPLWNTTQALAMFIMHLFGDVFSTTIVGTISDRSGLVQAIQILSVPMLASALLFIAIIIYVPSKRRSVQPPNANELML